MRRYFLDSSALVKRYHIEEGTERVVQLFAVPDGQVFISRLAWVELHSSFARLVRERAISSAQFQSLIARFQADVANGLLKVNAVSGARLQEASELLATYAVFYPIRTLDAIQLATAQSLHRRHHLAGFVAADKRLLASAAISGLPTIDVG